MTVKYYSSVFRNFKSSLLFEKFGHCISFCIVPVTVQLELYWLQRNSSLSTQYVTKNWSWRHTWPLIYNWKNPLDFRACVYGMSLQMWGKSTTDFCTVGWEALEANKTLFKRRSMLFVSFQRAFINNSNVTFFQSLRNIAKSLLPDWLNSSGKELKL